MTLGGRSASIGLIAALSLLALLIAVVGLGLLVLIQVLPVLLMIAMLMAVFARSGFSPLAAAVVCLSFLAQPGVPAALARLDGPVWLCLTMLLVAISATSAVSRQNLRPVITLGLGLALLEAVDPIGVFVVAAFIPVLLALPSMRANGYQAVAVAMLVMFVPAISAVLLWQIGLSHPLPPLVSFLTAMNIPVHASSGITASPFPLIAVGAGLIPAFAASIFYARTSASLLSAMFGLLVVACFAADAFLGTHRQVVWLQTALLPIAAIALAAVEPQRETIAIAVAVLGLAGSWAIWSLG